MDVVAIFGPTASGKSAVAELVADAIDTEVVSADALQVYRGLEILTNQPARDTHLVAIRELTESMSVGEYSSLAHAAIDRLVEERGSAVVTGGTGLYLRAALAELDIPRAVDADTRRRWEARYDADPAAAYARLAEVDPASAASVHANDRRRVVRALELAEEGASLSPERDALWSADMRRPTLVVGLDVAPDELARRIAIRTEEMLRRGAAEEARAALGRSVSRTASKALGLDELVSLPPDDARARIVLRTRQYAAYQRKWMRRIPGIVLVDGNRSAEEVAGAVLELAGAG